MNSPGSPTDLAGDAVRTSVTGSSSDGHALTYSESGLPPGLEIDPSDGTIFGTIPDNAGRDAPYVVTVTGIGSGSASVTFAWVVNPPIVTMSNPGKITCMAGTSVDTGATGYSTDEFPLTYTASGLPPGLSLDSTNGTIFGTIANNAGQNDYLVTVTGTDDSSGIFASVTFDWTVNPPVVTMYSPGEVINQSGDTVNTGMVGSSTDGYALSYVDTGLPPGLSFDASTGIISGTIPNAFSSGGLYTVTVTGTDTSSGVSASETFQWGVDTYPAYLAAVAQADQVYSTTVLSAAAARQDAIDAGRATATSAANSAYDGYTSAFSSANATYVAGYSAALATYQTALTAADSTAAAAYDDAEATYSSTITAAQSAYDSGVAGDTQAYQTALEAADATYSASVDPYASVVQNTAHTVADSVYQAALNSNNQTLATANAVALAALQVSNSAADSAWNVSNTLATNIFTTAKTNLNAVVTQAEADAWSSYATTLANLNTSLASNEAAIQSTYDGQVADALSTWQGSEQTAWNTYVTSLANLSQAPDPATRITSPSPVWVADIAPFPGLDVQARDDVNFVTAVPLPPEARQRARQIDNELATIARIRAQISRLQTISDSLTMLESISTNPIAASVASALFPISTAVGNAALSQVDFFGLQADLSNQIIDLTLSTIPHLEEIDRLEAQRP